MIKNKKELYDIMLQMKEHMGTDYLLESLFDAMSDKELHENLEHIASMNDLDVGFDD